MEYYHILMYGGLSSHKFYHTLLPELHSYAVNKSGKAILFDFTNVKAISPLVIPNLLCLGYIIKSNYYHTPLIYVPDNSAADRLRYYLHDIDFVKLSKKYGLFEFTNSIDYGELQNILDQVCATSEFNLPDLVGDCENACDKVVEDRVRDKVHKEFGTFFKKYMGNFSYTVKDTTIGIDTKDTCDKFAENICTQLLTNALCHGRSFAFMTAQVNYKFRRVYLSIGDCGIGLKEGINYKIANQKEPFENFTEMVSDELSAIITAIFARAEDKDHNNQIYGLYPLVKTTIQNGGIVRIHSNNTRLILTENLLQQLEISTYRRSDIKQIRTSFLKPLYDKDGEYLYNVEPNLKYGGTHIEIEIPLVGRMN